MRRLMLLRHAKSDWSKAGTQDHQRVLAPRGREAAPLMGGYMARHGFTPDLVKVSTSQRTRQTWDLAAQAFPNPIDTVFEERIYEASPAALLAVIGETPADVRSLLLVGHNPGMQELARLLIGRRNNETPLALIEKFPTAALAVIGFRAEGWSGIAPHSGRLEQFVTPRSLPAVSD